MDLAARRLRVKELWDQGWGQMAISRELAVVSPLVATDLRLAGVTDEEKRERALAISAKLLAERNAARAAGVSVPVKRKPGRPKKAKPGSPVSIAGGAEDAGHDAPLPPAMDTGDQDAAVAADSMSVPEVEETVAAAVKTPPKLASYGVVGSLSDPIVVDIRRQSGTGWEWIATWNPVPRGVITPSGLPNELQKLAGGGKYAVYVFTAEDLANAKTVIMEQVPGPPRLPAHVAAAAAQAQAQQSMAQMTGAGGAPGVAPAMAGTPFMPQMQQGTPMQQPWGAWPQAPMWPQPPPWAMMPQMGQMPFGFMPQPIIVPQAPVPQAPTAPAGPSPEVEELKRQNAALAAKMDDTSRIQREQDMRREFADSLKSVAERSDKAIEGLGQQFRDIITRIADKPAPDPGAALTPLVSVLTSAMAGVGEQARSAADAAKSAGERSFQAVMDMSARQTDMMLKVQGNNSGTAEALKASGEMVGLFSKMAMSAIAQAVNSGGQEPAWVAPVREAVGQVGALAQTLVAGAMGIPPAPQDAGGSDEGGDGQPMLPASQPQQALPAPEPARQAQAQAQAPVLEGGAQREYLARLRASAPDLSADQLAGAVVHIYQELSLWNAVYPPLSSLSQDPKATLTALFGDMPAFQDATRRARIADAAAIVVGLLNPPQPAATQPAAPPAAKATNGGANSARPDVIPPLGGEGGLDGEVVIDDHEGASAA